MNNKYILSIIIFFIFVISAIYSYSDTVLDLIIQLDKPNNSPTVITELEKSIISKVKEQGGAIVNLDGTITFVYIDSSNADFIRVAGTFDSEWEKQLELRRLHNTSIWMTVTSLPLLYGGYEYKFIVNGEWIYDNNNPLYTNDGYGGFNSVFVVPNVKVERINNPYANELNEALHQIKILEMELASNYQSIELHEKLIEMYGKIRDESKIAEYYQNILNRNPEDFIARYGLGYTYYVKGDETSLELSTEEWMKLTPKTDPKLLALIYERIGDAHKKRRLYVEAINYYSKALEEYQKLSANLLIMRTSYKIADLYIYQSDTVEKGLIYLQMAYKSAVEIKDTQTQNDIQNKMNTILKYYHSQSNYRQKQRFRWTTLIDKDGLAGNLVQSILKAKDGSIWVGTTQGVTFYNGFNWKNPIDNKNVLWVKSIEQSADGSIWIGTNYYGLFKYDGASFKKILDSTTVNMVMADSQNTIWVATSKGAFKYNGKDWKLYTDSDGLPINNVSYLFKAKDGSIWFGTGGAGVTRYDGKNWETFTMDGNIIGSSVNSIYQTKDGTIYVLAGKVYRYYENKWELFDVPISTDMIYPWQTIYQTSDGKIWFGSQGSGISCYDNGKWRSWNQTDGLASNSIYSFMEDENGVLWIGTENGISLYDYTSVQNFAIQEGSSKVFKSSDNSVWLLLTFIGAERYYNNQWYNFSKNEMYVGDYVFTAEQINDKEILFGSRIGLSLYDGKSWKPLEMKIPNEKTVCSINTIRSSNNGKELWVGSMKGALYHFNGNNWENFAKITNLENTSIADIYVEQESEKSPLSPLNKGGIRGIWVATTFGGVYLYDGSQWKNFNTSNGMPSNAVNSICSSVDGSIWFGTNNGAVKYNGSILKILNSNDGLPSNSINHIYQSKSGLILFATNNGVAIYDGENISTLSETDGLPNNFITSITDGADGEFWFGTNYGTCKYKFHSTRKPETYIKPVYKESKKINKNTITFECFAITPFSRYKPEDHWYSYKLDNENWTPFTNKLIITLTDLSNGNHTLYVKSKNKSFKIDDTPAIYNFKVSVPIPLWIWAILITALSALVYNFRKQILWIYKLWKYRKFKLISPNPYNTTVPVKNRDMFFGRDEFFTLLKENINASPNKNMSLVLYGEKNIGKSSLLLQMVQRDLIPSSIPVFISFQHDIAGARIHQFFAILSQKIIECLREKNISIDKELETNSEQFKISSSVLTDTSRLMYQNPYHLFDDFLNKLIEQIKDKYFILFFDESEMLETMVSRDTNFSEYFYPYLRSIIQNRERISFVWAFTGNEKNLRKDYGTIFNFSTARKILHLDEKSAKQLITQPIKDKTIYDNTALSYLYRLCSGQPYLIQYFCSEMINHLNEIKKNRITVKIVEDVSYNIIESLDIYFETIWNELSRNERLIVGILSNIQKLDESSNSVMFNTILEKIVEYKLPLLPEEARKILENLIDNDIIEKGQNENFYFKYDLLKLWISENHPLVKLLDESYEYIGPYQLLEKLGEGGMGTVYKSRNVISGKIVALKVLSQNAIQDTETKRRFLREGEIGTKLKHPNIVKIYERGEHQGKIYISMEFINGKSLRTILKEGYHFTEDEVIIIAMQIGSALKVVHSQEIVHRDIKTENIMIDLSSDSIQLEQKKENDTRKILSLTSTNKLNYSVKLMDFGLARDNEMSFLTRTGTIMGTVSYMSPEQASGGVVDCRSDIYSLGIVMYELLTGEVPFKGENPIAVIHKIIHEEPIPPSAIEPSISKELERIVLKAINKKPGSRYQNIDSFLEDLKAINPI